jgi:hypothetical protein
MELLPNTDEQLTPCHGHGINLGDYIHDNSPQYLLIEDDPRNEDDYDSWTYGMEVLPQDHTWQSDSIDVSPSEGA